MVMFTDRKYDEIIGSIQCLKDLHAELRGDTYISNSQKALLAMYIRKLNDQIHECQR